MNKQGIEKAITELLIALGEDPAREGLKETPKRVAKMYEEVLAGIKYTNEEIANMYNKCFSVDTNSIVKVKDIKAFSFCEHHLALMYDMSIDVGYIPNGKVIGLSKIPRIVELVCKRLQLQEKIGEDIAEIIKLATGSNDVVVKISGKHACMTTRGVKARESNTTTIVKHGKFKLYENYQEFNNL